MGYGASSFLQPADPKYARFSSESAASSMNPSIAITSRPRQKAPGVLAVATCRATCRNTSSIALAPSRLRAAKIDDFAGTLGASSGMPLTRLSITSSYESCENKARASM